MFHLTAKMFHLTAKMFHLAMLITLESLDSKGLQTIHKTPKNI